MRRSRTPRPPAWVGIGAQRSGTTWFTDLLLTHPEVCLSRGRSNDLVGTKELHVFDRLDLGTPPGELTASYHDRFASCEGSHPGEFTPAYLRSPWAPERLKRAVGRDTLIICLLRDPVERFYSALRWSQVIAGRNGNPNPGQMAWSRLAGNDALWGGMYASHLRLWRQSFDGIFVVQFEAAVEQPADVVTAAWAAMGLDPVPLPPSSRTPALETDRSADVVYRSPELDDALRAAYRPEVEWLMAEGLIEAERWTATNPR